MSPGGETRILVIKLSALGDVILALSAIARIREAHPTAHITWLTTAPYAELAARCPYVDAVDADGRPRTWSGFLALVSRLRRARFERVYDLQNNDRTNLLFQLLRPRPPIWSGVAFGAQRPHRNPQRMRMHTLERQADQLRDAGIWPDAPIHPGSAAGPDLRWLAAMTPRLPAEIGETQRPLALIAPGAAPSRPAKRWPGPGFADIALRLARSGYAPVLIGGLAEAAAAREIKAIAPMTIDLTNRTDFAMVAALGARAALAVGNDTGPMHLIAAAGAPCVSLFSADSDPALCAPRGRVRVLRESNLGQLSAETVWAACRESLEIST